MCLLPCGAESLGWLSRRAAPPPPTGLVSEQGTPRVSPRGPESVTPGHGVPAPAQPRFQLQTGPRPQACIPSALAPGGDPWGGSSEVAWCLDPPPSLSVPGPEGQRALCDSELHFPPSLRPGPPPPPRGVGELKVRASQAELLEKSFIQTQLLDSVASQCPGRSRVGGISLGGCGGGKPWETGAGLGEAGRGLLIRQAWPPRGP